MSSFECSNCSKLFDKRRSLIYHFKNNLCSKIKNDTFKKVYKCKECDRIFHSTGSLSYHKSKTHGKVSSVKCQFCQRSCYSPAILNFHLVKDHGIENGESNFPKCTFCSEIFSSRVVRLEHMRKKHSDQYLQKKIENSNKLQKKRIFECSFCQKKFTRIYYRCKHENICKEKNQCSLRIENHQLGIMSSSDDLTSTLNVQNDQLHEILSSNGQNCQYSSEESVSNNQNPMQKETACERTPTMRHYLQNRRSFLQLKTPDISTPRRAKMNLEFGKETVRKYQKQVATLQQTIRRLRKKLRTMEDTIIHLEKECHISTVTADILTGSLPPSFLKMALRGTIAATTKYGKEIRTFALTLNFYSPKAYRYVWRLWKNLLPSPSTIKTWYTQINSDPGFSEESITALKAKVASSSEKVIAHLIWDEMDIRSEITFRNERYHGYVEMGLGDVSETDSQPLARKALVFMLNSLNDRWKLPIGYFLIDSIGCQELAHLVKLALELINDCGVIVRTVTFDGLITNSACCKKLGANLDINSPNFSPWFPHPCHPEERVFLFPDPPHALKLIRNTFGDYTLTDDKQRIISFNYIKELYHIGQERGLTSIPRITKRHIKYYENKMKVKLAAQLLSSSVYAGLLHAQKKNLSQFEHCDGTADFCKHFDTIFDMLNCRSRFNRSDKPYNIPVQPSTIDSFKQWCKLEEEYICNLRIGTDKTPVLDHSRHTGFRNFFICLHNIVPIFKSLQSHGLKYLLSYKMSQDHLEVWFSAVRSRGGNNNNPNCEQFKAIFKRLLVHHELRTTDKENASCADDYNIQILDVTSPPTKKNNFINCQMTDEVLNSLNIENITKLEDDIILDSMDEDTIAYIAGFIIKKLEEKKMQVLTLFKDSQNQTNFNDLINLKNGGRLITPKVTIVHICKEVEKQVQFYEKELLHPHKFLIIENEILAAIEEIMEETMESLDFHVLELIVKSYVRIKVRFLCRKISEFDKNIRHTYTKKIIFNHQ